MCPNSNNRFNLEPDDLLRFIWLAILLIILPLITRNVYAQERVTQPVDTSKINKVFVIIVQGNEKTKEEIILREMNLKPGSVLDPQQLELDRLRIQSLGIFNRVEAEAIPTPNGAIVIVTVVEMWYLYPYPIIFRNEKNWARISVGAGLLHTNFRGRREIINGSFWVGFNPALNLQYSNPWIFGQSKFYTSVAVFARRVRNRTYTTLDSVVNEQQLGFDWLLGKRFGLHNYFDVSVGYRRLSLSPREAPGTLSPDGTDHLPSLKLAYRYDTRDLFEYPHSGMLLKLWGEKTGFWGNESIDYSRYGLDARYYQPIGKTTLAVRAATNLSDGIIPVYDQVHLGFQTRIRGHFRGRYFGDNLAIGSAEFRFPIRKITYHDWEPLRSLGRYGSNLRFGINGGLFVDTGTVWPRGEKFKAENLLTGWGAGLHFFIPLNLLLRFEYAFNEDWQGQFILDTFVFF